MNRHEEMLIAGHPIGGPCDQSTGKQVVLNPWDGSVVGTAAEGGWPELRTCVASAHDAFPGWRRAAPADRSALLARVAGLVGERREELAELVCDETGKPITLARAEVDRTQRTFAIFAQLAGEDTIEIGDAMGDPRAEGMTLEVRQEPRGALLAIVPYNWPLNLAAHKTAPALATGNTVVLKPSHQAPLSTLALARIVHEAGCPAGVLNAWNGPPVLAERAWVEDPRIRKLSFTGSARVGWHLKSRVADRPATLELGGQAAVILAPDVDPTPLAARIAASAFAYAGQICISTQQVWVPRQGAADFLEALSTTSVPFGAPRDPDTVCGPMIDEAAARRLEEWIQEAVEAGARVVRGGKRERNRFEPTVITDVPPTVRLAKEEAFGPVLIVNAYGQWDEIRDRLNQSGLGIHHGLFSRDESWISRAIDELDAGGLAINDLPTLRFDALPYGGVKRSGFGREGGRAAMREMTESKVVMRRK